MFLRIKEYHMDVKFIFKFLIPAIAAMTFTLRAAHVCADDCNIAGDGLRIYISGSDESWLFSWSAMGIEKQTISPSDAYSGDRLNVYRGSGDKRSESLPQDLIGPNLRFDVPFALNNGKTILLSAIYHDSVVLIVSRKFAIIDITSRKVLRIIEEDYDVLSLGWSPTDNYFAVLLSQDVTEQKWKGPLDWISRFLGHPISYYTLYIAIYDRDGQFLCKKLLIEKLPYGRGYIEWK
jgi:hypothetical protein